MALLTLQTIVDKAARRCGHLAELLTTEQTQFMRENLGLILAHEANTGLNLWKVNKLRAQIVPDQLIYTLPAECETILNINYVTGNIETLVPVNVATTGTPIYTQNTQGQTTCQALAVSSTTAVSAGLLRFEYSTDNVNWTLVSMIDAVAAGGTTHVMAPIQYENVYWRISAYGNIGMGPMILPIPASVSFRFYSLISEIPMAPLNRDDYWNLPNKDFKGTRPLQYWFDRQNTQNPNLGTLGPQIRYWPVGNDGDVFVSALYGARIADPTKLKYDQYIDVPERWMNYIVNALAADSAMELPGVPIDRVAKLEQIRDQLKIEVYNGETDDAPIYFAPNISHYT